MNHRAFFLSVANATCSSLAVMHCSQEGISSTSRAFSQHFRPFERAIAPIPLGCRAFIVIRNMKSDGTLNQIVQAIWFSWERPINGNECSSGKKSDIRTKD